MNHRYQHILTPIRVGNIVIRTRMGMSKCNSQEQQGPEAPADPEALPAWAAATSGWPPSHGL